jgi:hypothetical protein
LARHFAPALLFPPPTNSFNFLLRI